MGKTLPRVGWALALFIRFMTRKEREKMANFKKNTKTTKANENWFEGVDLNDDVMITGLVKKSLFKNDNVSKYSVEIARHTPNDKIARAWITVIDFEDQLTVGRVYDMSCNIVSNKHEKDGVTNWTTDFIVNEVNELK